MPARPPNTSMLGIFLEDLVGGLETLLVLLGLILIENLFE